jgi:hypothetical protein
MLDRRGITSVRVDRFYRTALSWVGRIVFIVFLAALLSEEVLASQGTSQGEWLEGRQIMPFVSGKRIYLAVPLGGEIPLYYRADGYVDGSGEAAGLGRFLAPTDNGKWWVEENRLCQQWTQWYNGRIFCFTLEALGGDKVFWHRDDGEEGIARVGD